MQENKEIWMVQTKRADFNGLAMRLGVSPVAVRVMRNRGLVEEEEMRKYLYGTLDDLYDPRLMKGMEQAVELVARKLKEGKLVRIIGDYDIDGICSITILYKALKKAGADVDYVVPHRITDGYGINEHLIDNAAAEGKDTILTCDNVIAAIPQIDP